MRQSKNHSGHMFALLCIINFLFFPNSLCAAEDLMVREVGESETLFRLGFEIEFSSYGFSTEGQEVVDKSLILGDIRNTWGLYRDTLDSKVETSYSSGECPGIWNLEFKSLRNGMSLENPGAILEAIREITEVTRRLLDGLSYEDKLFGTKTYKSASLPNEGFPDLGVSYNFPKGKILTLVKKTSKPGVVRPQITYQLPLSSLPYLFRHLYILGSKIDIKNFFERPENMMRIKNLHRGLPKPVDGLILLFDYYVDRLMSSRHSTTEPGPKPGFSIMSRISFKSMYAHLIPSEQAQFRQHVLKKYQNFECRGYDYLNFEDNLRPLILAARKAREDASSYQKEVASLQGKDTCEEIRIAIDFYLNRQESTAALLERTEPYLEKKTSLLDRELHKRIDQPVNVCYAINEFGDDGSLERVQIPLSIHQVLTSIIDPSFNAEIVTENSGGAKIQKQSDWFSSPFPGLEEDYSMGVLEYPTSEEAIAVVEIRSYPSILGDIDYRCMGDLIEAEQAYMQAVKSIFSTGVVDAGSLQGAEFLNIEMLSRVEKSSYFVSSRRDKITSIYKE